MKAEIVAADERETGDARALASISATTFGNKLRSKPRPGLATRCCTAKRVALGMVLAFDFAVRQGICTGQDATRVRRHIEAIGLPTELSALGLSGKPDALLAHMGKDKKVRDGRITLILPRRIGDAYVTRDATAGDLRTFLADADWIPD